MPKSTKHLNQFDNIITNLNINVLLQKRIQMPGKSLIKEDDDGDKSLY